MQKGMIYIWFDFELSLFLDRVSGKRLEFWVKRFIILYW